MPTPTWTVFEFRAGALAADDVLVRRIAGREHLSQPYRFDVEFEARRGEALDLADLCGTAGLLTWRQPDGRQRLVHGLLSAVRLLGLVNSKPRYRAQLVPALARLQQAQDNRVFQEMAVPDIVKEVLDAGEVQQRWSLSEDYPALEYCVQHRETNLAFVSRLLEEAGIFYYFEHQEERHTAVFVDAAPTVDSEMATLPVRPETALLDEDHLWQIDRRQQLRSSKVGLRDFAFARPAKPMEAEAKVAPTGGGSPSAAPLAWHEYPGRFAELDAGKALARVRLEERQWPTDTFAGAGNCLSFAPGLGFEVSEHLDDAYNRKLFLVQVEHHGSQAGDRDNSEGGSPGEPDRDHTYRNSFVALDADARYRPERRARRPRAYPTTGKVVGPSGEEIFTDSQGRVKVQFPWDRKGGANDRSSCWIRCAQGWAGAGWGATFLPRVGQEVLVKFLDGDPDLPLVVGATYNGEHVPPLALPDEKTRSTLRSDSSLGGGGANELRLEDRLGAEEIYLHAQKDEIVEVRGDKQQQVGAGETLSVGGDRSLQVQGHHVLHVEGSDASVVGGSQTLAVSGSRATRVLSAIVEEVLGGQSLLVGGARDLSVLAASAEVVAGAGVQTVGADFNLNVGAAMGAEVGGSSTVTVGGDHLENVGAGREERVAKAFSSTIASDDVWTVKASLARQTGAAQVESVQGNFELQSQKQTSWRAKEFKLQVEKLSLIVDGQLALGIDKSGNISFGAGGFAIDCDTLSLKGSAVKMSGAGSADSAAATVQQLKPLTGDRAWVKVVVKTDDGSPAVNRWVRLEFPDGTIREGRTNGDGEITAFGPAHGNVKVSFPALDRIRQKVLKS